LNVSDFVRERRKVLNFTQKELSAQAGVSLSVVRRFEANRPYNPDGRTFIKMTRVLEADPDFMLLELEWIK
jgi:transcriptional regulator with XRE-family HTH domain